MLTIGMTYFSKCFVTFWKVFWYRHGFVSQDMLFKPRQNRLDLLDISDLFFMNFLVCLINLDCLSWTNFYTCHAPNTMSFFYRNCFISKIFSVISTSFARIFVPFKNLHWTTK